MTLKENLAIKDKEIENLQKRVNEYIIKEAFWTEQMKLKDVQAIFPEWRSAVNDLAEKTGFYEEGRFRIDGYGDQFFTHQRSIL